MPPITSRDEIRAVLNTDRTWSVYALADLRPDDFARSCWFVPDLALVYTNYEVSVLFAMGPASIDEAFHHVTWPVHLQLRSSAMRRVEAIAHITRNQPMWRCAWTGNTAGWIDTSDVQRLGQDAVPALQRLYADGDETSESPDFFFPSMVATGVFYGMFEGSELVAAAGTHVHAPEEGAAAIGNVYTRRDRRARGLGKRVTCAVLRELAPLPTVALNVRTDNVSALRIYEQLGFQKHCEFVEAIATRRL